MGKELPAIRELVEGIVQCSVIHFGKKRLKAIHTVCGKGKAR